MTPSVRAKAILVARRDGTAWVVELPDGTVVRSVSEAVVRFEVARLAQAAVRFPGLFA